MAKETEKIEQEKFYLTDRVRNEGYTNNNYKLLIDFEKDFEGKRRTRYASPGEMVNEEFKASGNDYLTGLTPEQIYNLAIAKVIKLKPEQRHHFYDYLKTIKRVKEEE